MQGIETQRYATGPRVVHWVMALLVIGALVLIETRTYWPRGTFLRGAFRDWHQQAGVVVFLLLWLRVFFRFAHRPPAVMPVLPVWQERAGHVLHALFYALLLVLPVLGVIMVQMDNRPVHLLGWTLPQWFAPDKPRVRDLEHLHELLGDVMIGAIAVHVAAAMWHHFVRGDNVLRRML